MRLIRRPACWIVAMLGVAWSVAAVGLAFDWWVESSEASSVEAMQGVGLRPGDAIQPTTLADTAGRRMSLPHDLRGRPTLLLTGSLTCPKSRDSCPQANGLVERFGDRLNVVLVYVIEAHPKGAVSPYSRLGVEEVTDRNVEDGVLHAQPDRIEQREALAVAMRDSLELQYRVVVDGMDNAVWVELGRRANTAVLLDAQGRCVFEQRWFEAGEMGDEIEQLLGVTKQSPER